MKKAIYLRKSRGVIEDLEKHKRILLKLCKENKWDYDLYEEIASSEKLEERKQLTKLLDNIIYYDGVVCIHMDRLSRNELHQALITQILREHNVKVITLNKTYDFNKENDILLGDFEKLIARQELRLTKTRLRRGKVSAFEKGLWVNGFPPMPYVYNKETKSLDIDEEKLLEFNRVKNLALKGYSCNVIAEKVGTNPTKVKRLLKSKVGLGYTKYKGEYRKGKHTPVITEEEYEKIENNLFSKTNVVRKAKHIYKFSDLIYCECGNKRTVTKFNGKDGILKCRYCGDSGTLIIELCNKIEEDLKQYAKMIEKRLNKVELESEKEDLEEELKYLKKDLEKQCKKEKNIKKMIINDLLDFDEGSNKLNTIIVLKKCLEIKRKDIETQIEKIIITKNSNTLELKELNTCLSNNLSDEEINKVYKTIINKIIMKDKKSIKIVWK